MRSAEMWRKYRADVIKGGVSLTSLSPHTARVNPPTRAEAVVDMQQHNLCGCSCERRRIAADVLSGRTAAAVV